MCRLPALLVVLLPVAAFVVSPSHADRTWQDKVLAAPYAKHGAESHMKLNVFRHDFEQLQFGRSVLGTPVRVGDRKFVGGLGTHSFSHVRIWSREPMQRFVSWVGVDNNERTSGGSGSVEFVVRVGGTELYRSPIARALEAPRRVDVDLGGARVLDLIVTDGGDGPTCDHADWAEAQVTLRGGKTVFLDQLESAQFRAFGDRCPFSFIYGGKPSEEVLATWRIQRREEQLDKDRTRIITTWTDPETGLRVTWEVIRYADFPALDWVLYFENTGPADTPIIENVQALDAVLTSEVMGQDGRYMLHKTNGAPSNPNDFEASTVRIYSRHSETLSGGGGRSSNKDFPFFKVEKGGNSFIFAVGWSGQWQAHLECPDNANLRVTAGLEKTHFVLHPGEKVRSPRILVMSWPGDTLESNARFRQLIYKHYAAKRGGKTPLPILFTNTCFTRGGGWLNECNAANQISLIEAYAPLGLEALITDAGWFEGGWPAGAGNWTPRKDAYPDGMAPVAAAAKQHGMVYGLWFEPERVVAGTGIHKEHPEWCLSSQDEPQTTYLLNFGLSEVQGYFFNIVTGFMELPGFEFYRQDFNMDPLPYWRYNDAPDRVGITEMKYIEGLYSYWDRIAHKFPNSIREECSSGGRRIDLETVMRMHLHQESDYWFDNETDQNQIWGLSRYLPNSVFDTPLVRLDDYSFHSTMACSLIPGWIADEPGFDTARAKKLLDRYLEVRHLLVGAWYPLLDQSRSPEAWMASQWHAPGLNEGMIIVLRRPGSPYRTVDLTLHGLDPNATYELSFDSDGHKFTAKGSELMNKVEVTLPDAHSSDLITYRQLTTAN